jgi:hypothetical protein
MMGTRSRAPTPRRGIGLSYKLTLAIYRLGVLGFFDSNEPLVRFNIGKSGLLLPNKFDGKFVALLLVFRDCVHSGTETVATNLDFDQKSGLSY